MRSIRIALFTAALGWLLSACAAPAPQGEAIVISPGVEAHLKEYLRTMGSSNYGAFAVNADGHHAYYVYCTDGGFCERVQLNFDALAGCKKLAGSECIVLAHNRTFLRPYRVAG